MIRFHVVYRLPGPKGVIASVDLILEAEDKAKAITAAAVALDDIGLKRWALTWIAEVD